MSLISLETKIKFSVEDLKVYRQYLQAEINTVEKIILEKSFNPTKHKYLTNASISIKNEDAKKNKLKLIKQLRQFYFNIAQLSLGLREAKDIVDHLCNSDLASYTITFPLWATVTQQILYNSIDQIDFKVNSFN